jgi:hypothetical protein
MTIDRYTKAVLTVIAACLLWMCVMGTPVSVQAQQTTREAGPWSDRVQPVLIVGTGSLDTSGKVTINFAHGVQRTDPTVPVQLPYTPSNPLPAHMSYTAAAPLPVEIASVKKTGEWDPLRAHVEDAPTRPKPGGGQ